MKITRRQVIFVLLGLVILMAVASAQETVDTEKNLITYSNSGFTITTNNVIGCKWADPNSNWKQCEAVFEINNTNAVDVAFKNAGGALANIDIPMQYAGKNMQYYFSLNPVPTKASIINQSCAKELNMSDMKIREDYRDGKLCRYSYIRNVFSDWKPITDLTKLPKSASIGIKVDFDSPIVSSGGKYIPNQFNFSLGHVGGTLAIDPAIADCAELILPFSTYDLTADIINSADIDACMNITADNVILDCGNHLVDGQNLAGTYGALVERGIAVESNVTITNCTFTDWAAGSWMNTNNITISNTTLYDATNDEIFIQASSNVSILNDTVIEDIYIHDSNGHILIDDVSMIGGLDTAIYIDNSNNITISDSIINGNVVVNSAIWGFNDNNHLNFQNLTVNSNTGGSGIYLSPCSNSNFTNITASLNDDAGIYLDTCTNSKFTDITTNGNTAEGIYSGTSDGNNFTNVISNGNDMGLYLEFSTTHILTNISMNGNNQYGMLIESCNNNTITNTTASTTTFNGLALATSDWNIITDSTTDSNTEGIYLQDSDDNIFFNIRTESNTDMGIYLDHSDNNTINFCELISNAVDGLYSTFSENNVIYNNFFNNTINSITNTTEINYWNTTYQLGTRIYSSGTYIGGNYYTNLAGTGYSDTCTDGNKDGFCDLPYDVYTGTNCTANINCGNNTDYLALSSQYLAPSEGGLPNGADSSTAGYGATASNESLSVTQPINLNLNQNVDLSWLDSIFASIKSAILSEYGKIPLAFILLFICAAIVYLDTNKKGKVGSFGILAGAVFILTSLVYLKVI